MTIITVFPCWGPCRRHQSHVIIPNEHIGSYPRANLLQLDTHQVRGLVSRVFFTTGQAVHHSGDRRVRLILCTDIEDHC
jgi:hypothetical protein